MILEKYTLVQNILLGLTLAAPIGPVNLEIIKRGLNSGFKQAFLTGAGAMCADTTYLILIFFGLTSFLNFAFMKIFLGIAGSIILIYLDVMSAKTLRHSLYAGMTDKIYQSLPRNRVAVLRVGPGKTQGRRCKRICIQRYSARTSRCHISSAFPVT